jgi:predicted RNA-binding protein with TRAM domain
MVEVPERLRTFYTTDIIERDGSYVVEVPSRELDLGTVEAHETVRVAILETIPDDDTIYETPEFDGLPVAEGDVLEVTIESIGDQGDGIAKVGPGYVIIVPETEPGEQPTVELEEVKENVGFARVID